MSSRTSKRSLSTYLVLFKRIIIVVMAVMFGALVGLLYSAIKVEPVYTATRSVILRTSVDIDNKASSVTNNVTLAKIYLPVISDTVKSPEVIGLANENYTSGGITSGAINVEYGETSLIFSISYSDVSSEFAKQKLEVVIASVKEVISHKDVVTAERATLIDVQSEADISVHNNFFNFVLYGAILGAVISCVVLFIQHLLDNTVKDKGEFEESTGISVLAYIEKQKD